MCDHVEHYTYLPPFTIGGATGDYFLECTVKSGRWAEYAVDSIANGDVGTSSIIVSGTNPPVAAVYDGSRTFSYDTASNGVYYRIPATTTYTINGSYTRIQHSQFRVFVRIDTSASNSCYVTIRMRVRHIEVIPGLIPSASPHDTKIMDEAR